jgi:LmbE family N-acetylglucosaminyl deacetylase
MTSSSRKHEWSARQDPPEAVVQLGPADRLMVVAPHPDDESLATAGLVLAARAVGASVRIVYMTSGQNNPWAQLVNEGRWPRSLADRERWGARRRREVLDALAVLGLRSCDAVFLDFPDQRLTDLLVSGAAEPISALTTALDAWCPTVVAAPAPGDRHPDHNSSAVLVRLALRRSGMRPRLQVEYMVHVAPSEAAAKFWVGLGARELERKRAAIHCHVSQLWWRRRQFLAFVNAQERYETVAAPSTLDERHPVRRAWTQGGSLHLELAPLRPLALGHPTLRVMLDLGDRWLVRSIRLRGWRHAAVAGLPSWRSGSRVELDWRRHGVPALGPRLLDCFVKVDWPLERRLGFFDRWGWRAVPVPRPAIARPKRIPALRAERMTRVRIPVPSEP